GWHGGGRAWHGGSWGRHGYHRGFYGGYYPGFYGLWGYPYYSYGYADYPSYGYSDSYYDPTYYASPPAPGIASEYGSYAPPAAVDNTASLTVREPSDAQLWFQGTPTNQGGAVREFESPQLPPGREYTY